MSTPVPQPVAMITLLDVYTKQVELAASLTVIQSELQHNGADVKDHEKRLRKLEQFRWSMMGGGLAAGGAAGWVVNLLLVRGR